MSKDQNNIKQQDGKAMHWYIVQVLTTHQNKAQVALRQAIAAAKLDHMFGEIMVPSEEVVELKDGKERKRTKQFFPGYMLVEMTMTDETWLLVKSINGIKGFLGGGTQLPVPLKEDELERIKSLVDKRADAPRPKHVFEVGEVVRITEESFAGVNGVVEEVNQAKSRLKVLVVIFGRSTPVELEFSQVEKLVEM